MKIALFVDGNNLYGALQALGWAIDFNKLIKFASKDGELVDAIYFYSKSSTDSESVLNAVSWAGFSMVIKPANEDKETKEVYKANMDIEIASTILLSMPTYDKAILVTGDGDFDCILSILRNYAKQFSVISTDAVMSKQLKQSAGIHYIDIRNHRDALEYHSTKSKTHQNDLELQEELDQETE